MTKNSSLRRKLRRSAKNIRRSTRRRLQFLESLEQRRLLAADLIDVDTDFQSDLISGATAPAAANSGFSSAGASDEFLLAEGEPQQDLVQFAKELSTAGVIFFGADWCPACNAQKALFSDGAEFLPFVEVTNPDGSANATGTAEQISSFPTWQFPGVNGGQPTREVRSLTLQELSDLSGIAIPSGEDPSIQPIEDISLQSASPQHVAVNAYDPNVGLETESLTITVVSSNPSVVAAEVLQGNRSAVINVVNRGSMTVELFEQRAPIPTARFIEVAEAGGFDNNDFHRIAEAFVIQAGLLSNPPSGLDTSTIIDDFHPELQHSQSGVLSYAKTSVEDSGTTQWFLTNGPAPHLDFNHPVFGQLTEGDDVRKSIQRSVTGVVAAPVIESVDIITDNENGVIKLLPLADSGTSTITVTVEDLDGNIATETFTVTIVPDVQNAQPFLVDEPLLNNPDGTPQQSTVKNVPLAINLEAIDVEDDDVIFTAAAQTGTQASISGDVLTVIPPTDFIGTVQVNVAVSQANQNTPNGADDVDSQIFSVAVTPASPSTLSLINGSDTGESAIDGITSDRTPTVRVENVEPGAFVRLMTTNGDVLAQGTSGGNGIDFNLDLQAFGDGPLSLVATQEVNGLESPDSVPLDITIDTAAPDLGGDPTPATVMVGEDYTFDASTPEEVGRDFVVYSLSNKPANMAIDAATGEVQWTPSPTQRGLFEPTLTATDAAGNTADITLSITSEGPTELGFSLDVTDTNGDPINGDIIVDETFLINVFIEDISENPTGVKNAYFDLALPNTWMRKGPAIFNDEFFDFDESDISQTLIDEVGAGSTMDIPVSGPVLLAQLPVVVSDGGEYDLQLSEADRDSERKGVGAPIDPSEIAYGDLSVTVVSPFTAGMDARSVDEDSLDVPLTVLSNDAFLSGYSGTLTITMIDVAPTLGTAIIVGNDIEYTPDPDVNGSDIFTYVITDDQQRGTVTGTVSVAIQAVNDAPVADDDTIVDIAEGSIDNELDLLANDNDIDDDDLVISEVTQPANGTVTLSPNGTFVNYTPETNFDGNDSFEYTVSDGRGGFDTATVSVSVNGVNDPPVANDDLANVDEDDDVTIDVLDNDDVVDGGEVLTVTNAVASQGNAAVVGGTQVSYSPPTNFHGVDTIVYNISDGNGFIATATVTVTVAPVNDDPVANDDPDSGSDLFAVINTSDNVLDVLANDTDVDGDALTIVGTSGFSNGGSALIVDGALEYSPASNFTGIETFTYTIEDPSAASSSATVTVEVLEFVPSSLAGRVFLDSNNNGTQDAGETGLQGVTISLTGTADTGQSVDTSFVTNAAGDYQFPALRPGDYVVTEAQPGVFDDGIDTIGDQGGAITSNDTFEVSLAAGVDGANYNFAERGRATSFRSIKDLFRSSSRTNVFAAVDMSTGDVTHWSEGNWQPTTNISYDENGRSISVSVEHDGQLITNSFNIDTVNPSLVAGESGSVRVFRMLTLRDITNATPVSGSPSSGESEPGAEGEPLLAEGEPTTGSAAPLVADKDELGVSYQDSVDALFASNEVDELLAEVPSITHGGS